MLNYIQTTVGRREFFGPGSIINVLLNRHYTYNIYAYIRLNFNTVKLYIVQCLKFH